MIGVRSHKTFLNVFLPNLLKLGKKDFYKKGFEKILLCSVNTQPRHHHNTQHNDTQHNNKNTATRSMMAISARTVVLSVFYALSQISHK